MKLTIVESALEVISVIVAINIGAIWVAYLQIIVVVVELIINSHFAGIHINYSFIEQIKDIIPNFIISVIMATSVYIEASLLYGNNELMIVMLQILTGIFMYIILSIISHNESYKYISNILVKYTKEKITKYFRSDTRIPN